MRMCSSHARAYVLYGLCAATISLDFPPHADAQPEFGCPARAILGSLNTADGDAGPRIRAQLFAPAGLARDPEGNKYIADTSNNRVRKVSAAGTISTIAGNGLAASSGDGGRATQASLNLPVGVAIDRLGNIYISESKGLRVRRIAPDGTISTFAGVGRAGFSGDGSPARTAMLNFPADLAVDSLGNVYVLDVINSRVRRISTDGTINTVLGGGSEPAGEPDGKSGITLSFSSLASLAIGTNGDLLTVTQGLVISLDSKSTVHDVTGPFVPTSGVPAEGASARKTYMNATAIATLPDGTLAVEIHQNNGSGGQLWQIRSNGSLHKIAGTKAGGYLLGAEDGTVLLSSGQSVFSYSAAGQESIFAGTPVSGLSGDGGPAASALVSYIGGIAVDGSGNVYVSDTGNNRIRRVTPGGQISTFAGTGGATSSGMGALPRRHRSLPRGRWPSTAPATSMWRKAAA
jgi:trimeric autotransporter adhesin